MLAGFILVNVAVMVVALIGTVAPSASLDLALPAGYSTLVLIGSAMTIAVAAITRTAWRAWGGDLILLLFVGAMLHLGLLGLTGPWAPYPSEHMEATLAAVAICVLLLAAILLGRAQRPASSRTPAVRR